MRTHGFGLTAALCCTLIALSACPAREGGQSGDEGSDRTQSPSGVAGDGDPPPYCNRSVYEPEGLRQAGSCVTTDERYLAGELRWTSGPTPSGPYECSCD